MTLEVGATSARVGVCAWAGDGGADDVKLVDLFERETRGFVDEEVGEDTGAGAGGGPNEEHLGAETGVTWAGLDEVGGRVTDTKVPKPVGGDAKREGLGTDGEGEDFTADDPSGRAPGGSEAGDVDADKGDEDLLARGVGLADGGTGDGDDQFADSHPGGTEDEKLAATDALHHPHARDSGCDVDDVGDDGEDEGVAAGDTGGQEEGGAVVEDEVDTGELLPSLEGHAGSGTEELLALAHPEAVEVGCFTMRHFDVEVGLDVGELRADEGIVHVGAVKTCQGAGGVLGATLLDVPARGLGEDKHADGEDDCPGELDGDRDTVRARVGAVLGAVVGNGSDEKTDGDAPLVARDDGTTNPTRSALGLVHGDNGGHLGSVRNKTRGRVRGRGKWKEEDGKSHSRFRLRDQRRHDHR